jgi:hypothetical protein
MGETLYIKDYYDAFHIEKMMVYKRIEWRKSPILRGTRYRMLMKSQQGRDAFLVFSAIADLVVKHKSLGKLVDSDGFPITPEVIEIDTGIPLQVCEEAYVALCDPKIGWLTTDASKIGSAITHQDKLKTNSRQTQDKQDDLASSLDKSREEKKKTPCSPPRGDGGGGGRGSVSQRFIEFWQAFPSGIPNRKQDRKKCAEVWASKKLDDQADRILADVKAKRTGEKWTKDKGAFIEAPLVYLRNERWMDQDATFDWRSGWKALSEQTRQEWTHAFKIETKDRQTRPGDFGEWVTGRLERVGGAA